MQGRAYSSTAYRFGFNGKEKEADGTADNYNFGARIYDGRLGRWLAVDVYAREYVSWTPYKFAKCSPNNYADYGGLFEIDEKTAATYPKFDSYLKNLSATYTGKPEAFKKAFKQYSELTDKQIESMLVYKKVPNGTPIRANQANPRIVVAELTGANGQTPVSTEGEDKEGNYTGTKAVGSITLDKTLVDNFEASQKDKEDNSRNNEYQGNVKAEADLLLIESTLFHEATHYGDALNGTMNQTNSKKKIEGGKAFETKVYGQDIDPSNAWQYVYDKDINQAKSNDERGKWNQETRERRQNSTDHTRVKPYVPIKR